VSSKRQAVRSGEKGSKRERREREGKEVSFRFQFFSFLTPDT
jgi:hypothetical protein